MLKIAHMCCLTVSMAWDLGLAHKAAIKVWAGLHFYLMLRVCFQTPVLLAAFRAESLHCLHSN